MKKKKKKKTTSMVNTWANEPPLPPPTEGNTGEESSPGKSWGGDLRVQVDRYMPTTRTVQQGLQTAHHTSQGRLSQAGTAPRQRQSGTQTPLRESSQKADHRIAGSRRGCSWARNSFEGRPGHLPVPTTTMGLIHSSRISRVLASTEGSERKDTHQIPKTAFITPTAGGT